MRCSYRLPVLVKLRLFWTIGEFPRINYCFCCLEPCSQIILPACRQTVQKRVFREVAFLHVSLRTPPVSCRTALPRPSARQDLGSGWASGSNLLGLFMAMGE